MVIRKETPIFSLKEINKFDWLLIIGLVLAPMTGLRVWKIGPAEVLCLIWGLRYFPRARIKLNVVLRFFACFLIALLFGALVGRIVAPNELSYSGLLTWAYLAFIACALFEGLSHFSLEYLQNLLNAFLVIAAIWYGFLYVFSITISSSFLGAPLWYGNGYRFSGGGTNPHQVAILLCGLVFLLLRNLANRKHVLLNLALMVLSFYLMLQTQSSTGVLAIACGFAVFLLLATASKDFKSKKVVLALEILLLVLLAVVFYRFLWDAFLNWVRSDKNGEGRFEIFSSITETFRKSPIFGLGPGTHGESGTIEYHNTYLEILAATGIIGCIIFLLFTIRMFLALWRGDWKLIPVMVSMYAYGFAGFAMRRLIYWGIVIFILVIAEKTILAKNQGVGESKNV